MATYYNGNNNNNNKNNKNSNNNSNSEIEGEGSDGLQTLLLMNQNTAYHHLGSFSDTTQSNNNSLVFLNSLTPRALPHAPMQHQNQHLVGIPLHHPNHPSHHETPSNFMPRVHYNMYPTDHHSLAAREPTRAQQGGLSLSLSRVSTSSPRPSEVAGKADGGGLLGSRYLKAAQELLDEVVSVGKEVIKSEYGKGGDGVGAGGGGGEVSRKDDRREISTTERQEIQMKKAKLVGLLDEVEQRYRQYHHQMQIVNSWFEQATGTGSAKTYTALALQTISKQFRCLKDAISTQIRASSKSLGEEESFGVGKSEGGSRLKFVDHQIRQQRALQQLGMMQPNAWRPQRGLPERSVSVLRAWLFEHFLHPYPKDSDKIMLAKQTGLTRSQVSNWFINARVRLWKPMVEEMYTEEIKEKEHNGENSEEKTIKKVENSNENSSSKFNSQQENTSVAENNNLNFKSMLDTSTSQNSPTVILVSPSSTGVNNRHPPGFTLIGSQDMEAIANSSPKKQRNTNFLQSPESYLSNEQISMKFDNERQNRESFTLMGGPANFIGEFGGYPISEISRFGAEQFPTTYSGNGVALTLGLPHCENQSQNFLQNQNIQMGRRLELGETNDFDAINALNTSHSSVAYESVNIQNRKRFAAQLLPDFVT